MVKIEHLIPWEPTISFIFRGYKLIYWGFKSPSFFVVLGSKGMTYMITHMCSTENLFWIFFGRSHTPDLFRGVSTWASGVSTWASGVSTWASWLYKVGPGPSR